MLDTILAGFALVIGLAALASVGLLWRRSDVVAARAQLDARMAAHLADSNAVLDRVVETAGDLEHRRRKLQGVLDRAKRKETLEERQEQSAQAPVDDMTVARERLRARGVPFSG